MPEGVNRPVIIENGHIYRVDDRSWTRTLRRWKMKWLNPDNLHIPLTGDSINHALQKGVKRLQDPRVVVALLIGANVCVYLAWQRANGFLYGPSFNILPRVSIRDMQKNFLLNYSALNSGRWWTLLTYSLSHADFIHITRNMVALWQIGIPVAKLFGIIPMLLTYVAGAAAGGLAHILLSPAPGFPAFRGESALLGASGAVLALVSLLTVVRPNQLVNSRLIAQPVPMWLGVVLVTVVEFLSGPYNNISHAAHFAGMGVGALFGLYARFRRHM